MASQTHDPFLIRQEDQETAVRLANTMKNSLKGRPVQEPIFEGKVPPQFCCTFQHMVVLKVNQTESVALIQVSGTRVHNNKALQVEANSRERSKVLIKECTKKREADVLIWKMDLEARSLQPSAKAVCLSKLKDRKLMEFKRAVAEVSADQRGRLAMSVKRLDQSKDRVREIRRLMLETEEVGISVFQDLNQQCQTLLHVHTKVVKIDGRVIGDGKVGRVTRTLQNAYKKDRGFWCANAYLPRTLKYKTRGFEHEGT
ncbi:Vesicle transport v-SNARE N-terminal [Arabidopsis suecica]|uniref:Vesicle transport v-SNARE N-terminal n=1 Tax=Arabidopsis suecica TaxID=45249 RepID=A0A8T1ZCB5_ARASU|nr:Vesicle transport v-SNARE N-terminal [Arabidopsis suecica]